MKKQFAIITALAALLLSGCAMISQEPISSSESSAADTAQSVAPVFSDKDFSATVEEYEYNIPARYYSEGIKNIVRRARQISELHWTPISTVVGFNGDTTFKGGTEVIGLPYGQPVYNGKFICYDISLEDFMSELQKSASSFYTDSGRYEEIAPYYSLDCSTLVCYAWERPKRMIASLLTQWGDYCGSTASAIEVGDALIAVGDATHAVLVTGVKEDANGKVIWVEITEETPPLAKVTRYGEGELFSMSELNSAYFEKGYGVYRNTDYRDGTTYRHSCASPIDGEHCDSCRRFNQYSTVTLDTAADSITVLCSSEGGSAAAFAYAVESIDYGLLKYRTPSGSTLRLRSSPQNGDTLYYIPAGTTITTSETRTMNDGSVWGKVRNGGKCGWVSLDECTKGGGTLERIEPKEFKADISENIATAVIPINENELFDDCRIRVYVCLNDGSMREIGRIAVKKV